MNRVLATTAFALMLRASLAWACGGPIPSAPGYPGTALFESQAQISVFTANSLGYSWDRLQGSGSSWASTHVADVSGTLTGTIETDARVTRAIASQNGAVVEISSTGVSPISSAPEATTTVFGAALDTNQNWQVLTYSPATQTLALFSETTPGSFNEVDTTPAACGQTQMLDAVVEQDGTFVGLCGGQAVQVVDGKLQLQSLLVPVMGLARSTGGVAVFYGLYGSNLARLSRSGSSWGVDSTITTSTTPQAVIAANENSVLVQSEQGFSSFSLVDGTWQPSPILPSSTPVTSAFGPPAEVLGGQYELTLYTASAGTWQQTDLGPIGVEPKYTESSGFGCQSAAGSIAWPLFALALVALRRQRGVARDQ
jgi:uncharacterized protein (TIGR03382 family)